LAVQIQIRRDTAANWTSVNPTLAQGEIGHETDTNKTKIGDGTSDWGHLDYWVGTPVVLEWGNITGSIEDQTDLVSYIEQNYISVTHAELLALISGDELLPNWWYKITDYQTKQHIRGSSQKVMYTGEIEPIFVKAITTNKISQQAISAVYTNELITYNATIEDLNIGYNASFYNDGSAVEEYGDFTCEPYSANEVSLGNDFLDNIENVKELDIYFEDYSTGGYGPIGLNEEDKTYTWDDTTSRLQLLGFTQYWVEYDDGSHSGDETITVTASNTFTLTNLTTEPYTAPVYNNGIDITDYDNDTSYLYTWEEYGTTWEISASGEITLLNTVEANIDLTNSCYIYWEWKTCDLTPRTDIDLLNNECEFSISTTIKVDETKGLITSRNNIKRSFYYQDDYRGCKYRRYKVDCATYTSRMWTKGEVCRYSGYIWVCVATTPATPSISTFGWCRVVRDDYNITSNFFSSGIFISKDDSDYEDYFFSGLTEFDNPENNSVLNVNVRKNLNYELDIIFKSTNGVMDSQNSNLVVGSNTGGGTIIQYIKDSTFSGGTFVLEYLISGEIKSIVGQSFLGLLNDFKASQISACIIPAHRAGTHGIIGGLISCKTGMTELDNIKSNTWQTSIIHNTFKNSNLGSVIGGEFENQVDNATISKINGGTIFKNKITSSQFYAEVRNTTFNSQVLKCTYFGDIYGASSSSPQILPYMANLIVYGNISYSNIPNANIVNSIINGFSNCIMTASSSYSRIDNCFAIRSFANINDNGKGIKFTGCKFFGFIHDIQNLNSTHRVEINRITAYGAFGGIANGIYLNQYGTGVQYIEDTIFKGDVIKIYLKRGDFQNNETEDMYNVSIGSSSYQAEIVNSRFGKSFNSNIIGANNTTNLNNVKFGDNISSRNIDNNASNSVYDDAYPDTNITLKSNYKNTNNLSYLIDTYSNENSNINIKYLLTILDGSVGATTAKLPAATGSGTIFKFKAIDITNTCTVDATTNSGSIDGGGNHVFSAVNEHITICDTGTNTWAII